MTNDKVGKVGWRVMRILDARPGKNFGVFRADDVAGMSSPIEAYDAPCMIANCTHDQGRQYVRELKSGRETVGSIRARRQLLENMMYSGMN